MKYIILLGDGMADTQLEALGGKTPLEFARTPALDYLAQSGATGLFCPIPDGLPAGSDIGNLSCFGYDPRENFSGRAPIEAANQGIPLGPGQVCFRCNMVTLEAGSMKSFTADHITSEESAEIIAALNTVLGAEFPVRFHTGVSYRHLCVIDAGNEADALAGAACEPPHNITDRAVAPYVPAHPMLRAMMDRAQALLPGLPVNARRQAAGRLPATAIWLWGQGKAPSMQSFRDRYGLSGAVVSAVDLVMGIGALAGLEVLRVPGATGWIDTDYAGKIGAALEALGRHDFAYVHLEAPDETAHQGRPDLKVQAIEDYDSKIVAPVIAYTKTHPDTRILCAPDHFTLCTTKTHAPGAVPFVAWGPGVPGHPRAAYSEAEAAKTGVYIAAGHTLTQQLLTRPQLEWPLRA